jgi:uncharacterized protein YbaR (Trm112 family)
MERQTIDSQRGEIEFRKKLSVQHVTGEKLLAEYYDKDEHDKILQERMEKTASDMRKLQSTIALSPFIELGAERCQRSLVLANAYSLGNRPCSRLDHGVSLKNLPNVLMGGGIRGICRKTESNPIRVLNLQDLLACPDCLEAKGPATDPPPLLEREGNLQCSVCEARFPVVDDIPILLPTRLRRQLYPEFSV